MRFSLVLLTHFHTLSELVVSYVRGLRIPRQNVAHEYDGSPVPNELARENVCGDGGIAGVGTSATAEATSHLSRIYAYTITDPGPIFW